MTPSLWFRLKNCGEFHKVNTEGGSKLLEKSREISKFLDKTEMPNAVKQQIVLGVAFGANPDTIIKGAVSALSQIETRKAETENPKQETLLNYTRLERILVEMLTENSGANILDSGGAYGRHWQMNRKTVDFRELPEVDVTVWKDGEINATINVFHYLNAFVDVDHETDMLNKQFEEFCELPKNQNEGYLALMEAFAESLGYKYYTWNSYNEEDLLSQVLQGVTLELEDETFVILQIHGGCDVRGGYSKPYIFRIEDEYLGSATDLNASCKCGSVYSDDCGYHWYNSNDKLTNDDKLPKRWIPKPKFEVVNGKRKYKTKSYEYELRCRKCGETVGFWANLDY